MVDRTADPVLDKLHDAYMELGAWSRTEEQEPMSSRLLDDTREALLAAKAEIVWHQQFLAAFDGYSNARAELKNLPEDGPETDSHITHCASLWNQMCNMRAQRKRA